MNMYKHLSNMSNADKHVKQTTQIPVHITYGINSMMLETCSLKC